MTQEWLDKASRHCPAGILLPVAVVAFVVALSPGLSIVHAQEPAARLKITTAVKENLSRGLPNGARKAGERLRMTPSLRRQLRNLVREKESWTPVQRKIRPRLLMEYKRRMGMRRHINRMPGRRRIKVDRDDTTLVDIRGRVTPEVVQRIEDMGGRIVNRHRRFNAIRARVPISRMEDIAAASDVRNIRPAEEFMVRKVNTSEGDVAHRAAPARIQSGVDGTGKKACALSDSVEALGSLQASGDLPAGGVDVLPGQSGSGSSEGTALLEIIHDLAPGASLGFATANGGQAQFAQNIIDLRAAGCDVIIDDVFYFREPVFQDGVIAQAVDQVVADGALFFSSAGNGFNLNDDPDPPAGLQSGVWEGDFADSGVDLNFFDANGVPTTYNTHDFGGGFQLNGILRDPPFRIILQWSDRLGASSNDYDLYLIDSTASVVLDASMDIQNGNDDPIEELFTPGNEVGSFVLVLKRAGAANRMLHVNTLRGTLGLGTDGQIGGHTGARGAIAVAAVNVADAGGGSFDGSGADSVEIFSSDGPRRVFYEGDGTPITPGNYSSSGGELRQKPEIAAADGVSTATPGFETFFGTSASAPHAAAIATLLLSLPSAPSPGAVRDAMFNTAIDIEEPGVDRDSGHGIVDAVAALETLYAPRADLVAEWIKLKPTSCPGPLESGPPALIYESSISNYDSITCCGSTISATQFFGAEFSVAQPTAVNGIGGHFSAVGTLVGIPTGTIFGALVNLNGSGFPSNSPLTLDNVIASVVFTPTHGSDFVAPLTATLQPGTYGVVFGSGLFGASSQQYFTLLGGARSTSNGRIFLSNSTNWSNPFPSGRNRWRTVVRGFTQVAGASGTTECRIKGKLAVANLGTSGAPASTARIYFSPDATLDPTGDQQLVQFPVSALAPGAVQTNPVKLPVTGVTDIPANATVYVQLDVTDAVSESDEDNNLHPADGF